MTRLLVALLLLGCVAFAAADPDTARAKAAIEDFRKAFASEPTRVRMQALWDLAHMKHHLAIEEIGARVLTDGDPEVRAAGAQILGKVKADPEVAGPFLAKELPRNEDWPDVQIAIARAIGDVGYRGARKALEDASLRFLEEDYRFVTDEALRTLGRLKDVRALPFLLKLAEFTDREPIRGRKGPRKKYSSSDSTASKRWKWMREYYAKYGIPKGEAGEIVCLWMQELVAAVTRITGEELEELADFRKWMEDHAREHGFTKRDLDPKVKVKPKKPRKQRTGSADE